MLSGRRRDFLMFKSKAYIVAVSEILAI